MTIIPEIRVGVDWDDDWYICWDAVSGDEPNLIPSPLTLSQYSVAASAGGGNVVTRTAQVSDYGVQIINVTTDTALNSGVVIGAAAIILAAPEIDVQPNTTYTLGVWVKLANGTSYTLGVRVQDNQGSIWDGNNAVISTNWTKVYVTFTTNANTDKVFLWLYNVALQSAEYMVAGLMLVEGSVFPEFNTGTFSLHENITSRLLGATWELGKKDLNSNVAVEGIATFTLDNTDRQFSPEYTASPLYGRLLENLRVVIQVQHPTIGNWVTMWSGWIRGYEVDAGRYVSSGFVKIKAEQGFFRLTQTPLNLPILENATFADLLSYVVEGGWYSVNTPYIALLDRSKLDENFYMNDPAEMYEADPPINVFEFIGGRWATGKTDTVAALKEVLAIEGGFLFINREGKLIWKNRYAYPPTDTADMVVSINTDANGGVYSFGKTIINTVRVTVTPKEQVVRQIWNSKQPIMVAARKTSTTEITLEQEEGVTITVKSLQPFGAGSTIIGKTSAGREIGTSLYSATTELKSGGILLKITNNYSQPLWFTVSIQGTQLLDHGSSVVERADDESVAQNGVKLSNTNTSLITNTEDAENFGDWILFRFSQPRGVFDSIEINTRDSTWLSRQLALTLGVTVEVSDYQVGDVPKKLLVVGEQHTWQPGNIRSIYTLQPLDPQPYWILGESLLGIETILVY